jgi:acyl-CoA synthetase (AMP-forming)/AMP-acid ligase II
LIEPADWQAWYPPGNSGDWQPPDKLLWQLLEDSARRKPDSIAIVFEEIQVTYQQLWQRVEVAAATLRTRGFARGKRGDRVLLLLPNCPEFVVQYYAALRADMIVVALNHTLSADELKPLLASVEPRAAFIAPDAALNFERARQSANIREPKTYYITPGQDFRTSPQDPSILPDVLGAPPPSASRQAVDLAVLQFTSGTTGGVKAAMISHRNLVANALQNNLWFDWTDQDRRRHDGAVARVQPDAMPGSDSKAQDHRGLRQRHHVLSPARFRRRPGRGGVCQPAIRQGRRHAD